RPDIDLQQLDDIIRHDVSLTFKLLKYINSPFFGLQSVVTSIQHAMVVLGEKELRKWACLIALGRLGEDKPAELVVNTLIRARFCESLAPLAGLPTRSQDLFLMGIFSNVHVIVGRPLEEILETIPIAEEVKAALFGRHNRFREILELVVAYEKGNWPLVTELVIRNHLPEDQIPVLYLQAVEWAGQSIRA
ncbi:MAG: diguanylate phosphodiesterase, partial [Deltaproteobacteria bacterium CG_4_10_14_3_um_filter_60_8]